MGGRSRGGGVGGKGGIWNSSQVTSTYIWLWVLMWGGGWGNDGGGEGGEERLLIEVLNKTGIVTFSLVIVKHFTR